MATQAIHTELPSSFASALASFTSDDGLADDIALISYENAVRTQAGIDLSEDQPAALHKKSASITLRMSSAECAQLRKRAAAANLSVSAYMRSCILDAEMLRAQVREALAELRAATPDEPQAAINTRQSPRRWWQLGARSN